MAELLKYRYNETFFDFLCSGLENAEKTFSKADFMAAVYAGGWEEMELKARMRHLAHAFHKVLPGDFPQQVKILCAAIQDQYAMEQMCFPDFVEVYGLDHEEESLAALKHMTSFASAEFAIRPFIDRNPEGLMKILYEWAEDKNHHIRRLASEGSRPRLPWAMALPDFKKDPALVLPLLEKLKADPSEYVRRSVANNLNDIAKDNPDVVLEVAARWLGKSHDTDRLVKHACRTLLKQGNPDAMRLFGFSDPTAITIKNLQITPDRPKIGGQAEIQFEVAIADAGGPLRLEYGVDYMKSNGKQSRKIFQLSERRESSGVLSFKTKHAFKQLSTRKHYPGAHGLAIVVNGVEKASIPFELLP